MLSINTNIASLFGVNNYNRTQERLDDVTKMLSSGKRIISSKDDPAGVGIVSTMKTQQMSYQAVTKNIDSGLSLLNVAETSLSSQQEILSQLKNLATQAASDLLTADQRLAVQSQFSELQTQLNNIVDEANLFGQNLTGTSAADVDIQVGISAGSTFTLTSAASDAATLGVDAGTIDLTTSANAATAMTAIDTAVGTVAQAQSTMGTQQTGLEALRRISENTQTNIESSISRIEDADIPKLSIELSQLQTKMQLQTQMLGITNQMPQLLLGLLR
jgi:flagellin